MKADELLSRLDGVKRSGRGWEARCPAHDDHRPSLQVAEGEKGLLLTCYAGCTFEAVCAALGVDPGDLFYTNGRGDRTSDVVATYDYEDEDGNALFQKVRKFPKDFLQRHPCAHGPDGWTWGLGGKPERCLCPPVRRVLFRLPQILEAVSLDKLVHVCAGEKDALAVERVGGVATTNTEGEGSGKWRPEYSEFLRGARVRIIADRDDQGREHALAVRAALEGIAASVEIIQAREGKDASDHFAAGYGLDEFLPLDFAESTEVSAPLFDAHRIRFARFLESDPPERRWLLPDVLPLGVVGLLASQGGAGKSYFVYRAGISVVTGLRFMGLDVGEPGAFLYLAAEDDEGELHRRGRILLEHCEALACEAGVSLDRNLISDRLHIVSRVADDNLLTRATADGEVRRTPLVERLVAAMASIPDLRLIVIDPVSRFRGGRANSEEDATRFVEALESIRQETGATVLGLTHVSQLGIREGGGQEIVRGSTALVDGVRWVATLQPLRRDRASAYGLLEDEASRYLRFDVPKSNYSPPFPGMWLERRAGGVMVPTDLTQLGGSDQQRKSEREYLDIVERLQALLRTEGPLSRYMIRQNYVGRTGCLGAGDRTVRAVIERAVRDGSLLEGDDRLLRPPEGDDE